ncbi:hypothetical protein [Stenotrophomonas pavanii]|uniref:hypothetical protein n=1 Tax=Stenotrophomonas pavanii TaxID=487698 RepID=UPI0039C5C5B5
MQPACVQEVAAAIGRQPSAAEVASIEAGLKRHMQQLARTNPDWRSLSRQQREQLAAEAAQAEALAEATKAAQRRADNLLAQVRETERIRDRAAQLSGRGRKNTAHAAVFERFLQVDSASAGVIKEYMGQLMPALRAVEPRFFGLFENRENVVAFARAVIDGDDSNPVMKKAAEIWLPVAEAMRLRSNNAGTAIGKIDYGYLPQPHDVGRVARAGKQAWVDFVFPRLRREAFLREDGSPMGDAELRDLLGSAFDTISTEGRSKRVPGTQGRGSRASRFDDAHRVLHFKDADSHVEYMDNFGRGSMLEAVIGHVSSMGKNIAMMEELGPNPSATARMLRETAEQLDNKTGARSSWHEQTTLENVWDTLSGLTAQPVSAKMAQNFQAARSLNVMSKLQGVMLSSITDVPTLLINARASGVPLGDALKTMFKGFGKHGRKVAEDLAIGMDEIGSEMSRWHTEVFAQNWADKLANTTMRLTLVEAWTNGLRRSAGLMLSRAMERMRHTPWEQLDEWGRRRMESAGITPEDWAIWQQAEARDGMLTKDGIRAVDASEADLNRATARFLGYLDAESKNMVTAPDLITRSMMQQGTRAGTFGGEMLRTLLAFKMFPASIFNKTLRRIRDIPTTQGKIAYSVSMMASLQLFGAAALQLKDLVQGKDPRDMTTAKFWQAAFVQGGGAGILGDVFYTGMGGDNRGGQANWAGLVAGPVFGTGFDAFNVLRKGSGWAFGDENPDELQREFGAEAFRFAKGNAPFVNLWYLRGALDHMFFHDIQEQLSPGYLRRMRKRAQKDWNQRYWWEPGEAMPDRAPDFEATTGDR